MGGISKSHHSIVFLFTGNLDKYASGNCKMYSDGWTENGDFLYSGSGRSGDQKWNRTNLYVKQHREEKNRLFLFSQIGNGIVKFIGEMQYLGYEYIDHVDKNQLKRLMIQFRLKPDTDSALCPKKGEVLSQQQIEVSRRKRKIIPKEKQVPNKKKKISQKDLMKSNEEEGIPDDLKVFHSSLETNNQNEELSLINIQKKDEVEDEDNKDASTGFLFPLKYFNPDTKKETGDTSDFVMDSDFNDKEIIEFL